MQIVGKPISLNKLFYGKKTVGAISWPEADSIIPCARLEPEAHSMKQASKNSSHIFDL